MVSRKKNSQDKSLDYYLSLKWTWTVEPCVENGDRYYIIRVNELPGVCTDVENLSEAEAAVKEVIQAAVELYLKRGEEIPEPVDKAKCKGNIPYRTTPERHYQLLQECSRRKREHQKVSLSLLIDEALDQSSFMHRRP